MLHYMEKIIIIYEKNKKKTFLDWLNKFDRIVQVNIKRRIDLLSLGSYGDCKNLRQGLFELRRPGYRIYFTEKNNVIIILLYGGTKYTQERDIEKAREYLDDCRDKGGY